MFKIKKLGKVPMLDLELFMFVITFESYLVTQSLETFKERCVKKYK
jgi:hypothetical protein